MDETKRCPYCTELTNKDAIKCEHCGEILDSEIRAARSQQQQPTQIIVPQQRERKWSPGIAAVLSLIIPGAGQMYKGHIMTGLFWLIAVPIGYFMLVVPGLILHLICILAATSGDLYKLMIL